MPRIEIRLDLDDDRLWQRIRKAGGLMFGAFTLFDGGIFAVTGRVHYAWSALVDLAVVFVWWCYDRASRQFAAHRRDTEADISGTFDMMEMLISIITVLVIIGIYFVTRQVVPE